MATQLKFYSHTRGPYKCFSNFYDASVIIDDKEWPTTEHYFHAMKFIYNPEYQEKIRLAQDPYQAKALGRSKEYKIDPNWDVNREQVMFDCCYAKFTQHEDLQKILLSTGDAFLIENSPTDYIWGSGEKGTGKNKLGKVLMNVRDKINSQN